MDEFLADYLVFYVQSIGNFGSSITNLVILISEDDAEYLFIHPEGFKLFRNLPNEINFRAISVSEIESSKFRFLYNVRYWIENELGFKNLSNFGDKSESFVSMMRLEISAQKKNDCPVIFSSVFSTKIVNSQIRTHKESSIVAM